MNKKIKVPKSYDKKVNYYITCGEKSSILSKKHSLKLFFKDVHYF